MFYNHINVVLLSNSLASFVYYGVAPFCWTKSQCASVTLNTNILVGSTTSLFNTVGLPGIEPGTFR